MAKYVGYRNQFNRENYDRIGLMIPKGQKSILQSIAKKKGISLNALIYSALVEAYPDIEIQTDNSPN